MNVRRLAHALGGVAVGARRILAPGPGHSAADRSMSVLFDQAAPEGFLVNSFAGDNWKLCREHVRACLGGGLGEVGPLRDRHDPARSDHRELAARLWQEGVSIRGTWAETYLVGRGVHLELEALAGHALRFHPRCPFKLDTGQTAYLPAMIAAMTDVRTGTFRGIHRTALADGGWAKSNIVGLGNPKKMLGPAAGACIKLSPDEDVTCGLHIAEGIETALACLAMHFRPIWIALSAGGVASFPVLAGIGALTVFADNDETGRKSAAACSRSWSSAGKEVTEIIPAVVGTDFADGGRA
jgi:putative DNA primase/helicase